MRRVQDAVVDEDGGRSTHVRRREVPGGGPGPRAGKLRCGAHVTVDHTTMGSSKGTF